MSNVEALLYELETKCRMNINAPYISNGENTCHIYGNGLIDLYRVSNGVEINVPGTCIFPAERIKRYESDNIEGHMIEIGVMNFGDRLVMNDEGMIYQIDHETGEVFLTWKSLEEFLRYELDEAD